MYTAIEDRIDVLAARTRYPCRFLIVMGGILINSDYDVGSFCSFRRLVCTDMATGWRHDWLYDLLAASARLMTDRARAGDEPRGGEFDALIVQ